MAAQPSIRIVKTMPYRGNIVRWSNRHHFTNDMPTTDTRKAQFATNVINAEKAIYERTADAEGLSVRIVEALLYDAGSDVAVWSATSDVDGTGVFTSFGLCPGDAAIVLRFATTQRTSKNHPIYLFNYFHGALYNAALSTYANDTPQPSQKSAVLAFGNSWVGGISDGVLNHERCGPNGAVAQSAYVDPYISHRDFPN